MDNNTRQAHLVECFSISKHFVHHLPALALLGAGQGKLLHLFKLMHTEDSERVSAVRASLLPETSRIAHVALGHVLLLEPLLPMQCAQRLLRCSNHVLVFTFAGDLHACQLSHKPGSKGRRWGGGHKRSL